MTLKWQECHVKDRIKQRSNNMFNSLKNLFLAIFLNQWGIISGGSTIDMDDVDEEEKKTDEEKEKKSDADDPASPKKDEEDGTGDEDKPKADEELPPKKDEEETPVDGKYGEFGDNADKVWEAFNNQKGRMGGTEKNLASIRGALKEKGITINTDEEGNVTFGQKESETETPKRERKFTDEKAKQLTEFFEDSDSGNSFQGLIKDLIDDLVVDAHIAQVDLTKKEQANLKRFMIEQEESNQILDEMYPELDPGKRDKSGKATNPNFNKTFFDRATEIWEDKYQGRDPRGELKAAREAAKELQIILKRSGESERKGFQKGKAAKTFVAPPTDKVVAVVVNVAKTVVSGRNGVPCGIGSNE